MREHILKDMMVNYSLRDYIDGGVLLLRIYDDGIDGIVLLCIYESGNGHINKMKKTRFNFRFYLCKPN